MKIAADIIWSGGRCHLNHTLAFSDGVVSGVEEGGLADITLDGHAIIPGFANGHSHCFQRVIRGKTEWLRAGRDDNFWSWRDAMYHAANHLSPEDFEAIAEWTFLEMVKGGITAVGEFHYVHHQPSGEPYASVTELSERVIAAAQRVGLRITHLPVAYARGGHKHPLVDTQKRFIFQNVDGFLDMVSQLRARFANCDTVKIGIAPHSVRAVDKRWLQACEEAVNQWHVPLHIHVCEQQRELEECAEEYGKTPIELLAEVGLLSESSTLIHATHLSGNDLRLIGDTHALVCGCPTTEGNLGDGFLPAKELLREGTRICLGTDSNAQIDLFQEARLVEMQQRLLNRSRNVLAEFANETSGVMRTSDVIWPMMNVHGYQSLGWTGGQLRVGEPADFMVVDLNHPSLLGVTADTLLDTLILSGQNDAIREVYVNGRSILSSGKGKDERRIRGAYADAVQRLMDE